MKEYRDDLKTYRKYRCKKMMLLLITGVIGILASTQYDFDVHLSSLFRNIFFLLLSIIFFSWGVLSITSEIIRPELILNEDYLYSPFVPDHSPYYAFIRNFKIDMSDVKTIKLYKERGYPCYHITLKNKKYTEISGKFLKNQEKFFSTIKHVAEKNEISFYDNIHL